jgi:asparagine synthase (glutamine-hydrolysing)
MLALMSQGAAGRVKTYTVGFDVDTPYDELARARQIAQHFNADHHELVIDADDWWSGFERYIYYHDEPNANESAISTLLLAELTARDVKVVLTGLGGDELFGATSSRSRNCSTDSNPGRGLASGFSFRAEPRAG